MKYLDRFTGQEINNFPDQCIPGRLISLNRLRFNGHTEVLPGSMLVDDGSSLFRSEQALHRFCVLERSDDNPDIELSTEAFLAIGDKLGQQDNGTVSPMLPSEIVAKCEIQAIELQLGRIVKAGHLHAISDQPKRDLRYDELVAPIERARRLSTHAYSHLASHSEFWQQRLVSQVIPRKILSRVSEDDYGIYENRLYKRLLDRMERHLVKRRAKIAKTNSCLERHQKFQGSISAHHRLWNDICTLWGQSFGDADSESQLDASRKALIEIERLLGIVRELKQRGLYRLVPSNAVVPDQVHRTNILSDDPHYKQLPPLWEMLRNDQDEEQLRPEVRFSQNQVIEEAYSDYVGLVLRRALDHFEVSGRNCDYRFTYAGQPFTVRKIRSDWIIKSAMGKELRLIPIAWFELPITQGENIPPDCMVCWPGNGRSQFAEHCLEVSPLDLYVVERMGVLVDQWLLKEPLEAYGQPIGPFPTPVKKILEEWHEQFVFASATTARLMTPLSDQQQVQLREALRAFASPQVASGVELAIQYAEVLARCNCGCSASLRPSGTGDFYCRCPSCETTWSLVSNHQHRHFSRHPRSSDALKLAEGFEWAGRDFIHFDVHG